MLFNKLSSKISQQIAGKITDFCPKSFNKFGNRVYSNESVTNKKLLKNLHAPKDALKADIVEIEKNFGKDKVRIVSFKDKEGHLISRLMQNGDITTQSEYKKTNNIYEVFRKTFENDKLKNTLHSVTKISAIDKHAHINAVLKTEEKANGARYEIQKITQKLIDEPGKELITEGTRFADGSIKLENISGKNIEDMDTFKQDPYIMIRNYTNSDFVESLTQMLSERFNLKKKPKLEITTKNTDYYGKYDDFLNKVMICDINNTSKKDLINTVAHELRHAKQNETSLFKTLRKMISPEKYSPYELKIDKHYTKSNILYPGFFNLPLLDKLKPVQKAYINNGLEVDANKWGKRIESEYSRNMINESKDFDKNLLGHSPNYVLVNILNKLQ